MFFGRHNAFIISLIPPLFYNKYTKVKSLLKKKVNNNPDNIWVGIYKNWSDVPIKSNSFENFDGNIWADIIYKYTLNVKNKLENCMEIPGGVDEEHSFLPLLVSLIGLGKKNIAILDFGGGCGEDYIYLTKSIGKSVNLNYYIVENNATVLKAMDLFKGDDKIHFLETLPDKLEDIEIIYLNSSLQYIENYKNFLDRLCKYNSKYILFTRLSAGNIPTYATLQRNMKGMQMAYWFINIHEIIDMMKKNNYHLIFNGILKQEYDQDNFPKEYRIKHACNLLFKLKND